MPFSAQPTQANGRRRSAERFGPLETGISHAGSTGAAVTGVWAGWQFCRTASDEGTEDALFGGKEFKEQSWETVVLTGDLDSDGEHVIAVRLDTVDNSRFPPGKPARNLDFSYFGGRY
jgi:hypothetical protein